MCLFSSKRIKNPHLAWSALKCGNDGRSELFRQFCNDSYEMFKPYSDSDFVNKFKIEFFPQFWEMDLACTLIKSDKMLSSFYSGNKGPDICLLDDKYKKIWVEAICPDKGSTTDQIPNYENNQVNTIPSDKIILRITSAIYKKHKIHLNYIKDKVCSADEPYIIAINGCLLTPGPGLDDVTPRIVKAVFEGGIDMIDYDLNSGLIDKRWCKNKQFIPNHNEVKVYLGYFFQKEFSNISAVLYSDSSYCTRPTELGGDYILVHNPLAKNPLPVGFLGVGIEYYLKEPYKSEGRDYSLGINCYRQEEYLYSNI